jgi:lipid-binding SYLF domain-containing protein
MRKSVAAAILAGLFTIMAVAPAGAGWNPLKKDKAEDQKEDDTEIAEAIAEFKAEDPDMQVFFNEAYGYAIFPSVGKGAVGIGGAYGSGRVYEKGREIGTTKLTQVTVGFQLGGQAYREIIFFQDKSALDDFTSGNFEFSAQASAVALTSGVAKDAAYSDGVAIFTIEKGGLMYEAAIGGQKFSFDRN